MKRDVKALFAKKLIKIRQERKLTQEALALLCGVDRTHIGRMERLERIPGLEILDKIAIGLNIPLSVLLDF
jgi:transcriptional regulator with XRE-family HTH domain